MAIVIDTTTFLFIIGALTISGVCLYLLRRSHKELKGYRNIFKKKIPLTVVDPEQLKELAKSFNELPLTDRLGLLRMVLGNSYWISLKVSSKDIAINRLQTQTFSEDVEDEEINITG